MADEKKKQDEKDVEGYTIRIENITRKHDENIIRKEREIMELKKQNNKYQTRIRNLECQGKQHFEHCKKEIEDLKRKRDESQKQIDKLNEEIQKLKRELKKSNDQMESLERKIEENKRNHQKTMQAMKENYEKGLVELNKKIEEYDEASKWDKEDIETLRKENKIMKNDSKDYKKLIRYLEKDRHILYIGQVCSDLQNKVYRYVIPEKHCAEDLSYKIKDLEKDINDEEMLEECERKEAEKKMEKLKKKINWNHLKDLKRSFKLLQDQRNRVAHPQELNETKALFALQQLEKEGRLKGRISKQVVSEIIGYWSIVNSLHAKGLE